MKTEYIRNLQHNYLVIQDYGDLESTFQEKMIMYNKLSGILPFQVQQMNGQRSTYYDISGYQSLAEVCKKYPFRVVEFTKMIKGLLQSLQLTAEYLLDENDFIIDLEYMFIKLPEYDLSICYYAGYTKSIKQQLAVFFESFMSYVDYEDKDAVYLVYTLYMKSKEPSCTIKDLMTIIEKLENAPSNAQEITKSKTYDMPVKDHLEAVEVNKELRVTEPILPTREKEEKSYEMPRAVEAAYVPPNQKKHENIVKKSPSVPSHRPLISNTRQEEQEVMYYPSKCYALSGMVLLVILFLGTIVVTSGILVDSVTQRIEPIKLVCMLLVLLVPSAYVFIKIFDPKKKVSKVVTVGLYEPMIQQEIAVAAENHHYDSIQENTYQPVLNEEIHRIDQNILEESQHRTTLLNGITESIYPQLISEDFMVADTITITECPYYIGTVKNRMNYALVSPVISRYHAKIEQIEDAYYLIDLDSTNGTFVNGRKLKPEEPEVLVPGDKIAFANICFKFTCSNR